ncbi:MAG: UDP-N-acetylmuramoyl-L-alanine--D-glutamate ligase [Candidatus Cloacimonadaceae bacterium]|jgi:UDP-N-acetylmuramoylalanine--D-glutamate ligase|nr:UDP-N-acetylmuramoyl-L-alanine--D-glutamate ligase [Candidatus Cloacimonadota bacterium]MDY0127411.1 UDP-N-acetylmuramoyl-L-alanine--D-glutamate ligase [Candidatus Cloacimonadaceae bacterium]MCB5255743.1 UDP-N-acetylmuramoyl-L-alanine--D-glutamate ligase [Candidatus Cloacimonadota bacterium]MCK9177862.1 UDP-N-acetylmuramoyl-L-alanine--D-glutamate ligase [Candidatus Cloacimonadota bacterium]MCK9242063.1 UDP-N-acetylmuramoyl-L-alanine--D-glutamate ligase [Candidatus Cloacimonadota bacterium]
MFDASLKYGILGLARSGIAAAYKLKEMGAKVFLSELQAADQISSVQELKQNFACEFGGHSEKLLDCDVWIVSPGIPLNVPIISQGRAQGIRMISEIEFGYQIKAKDSKIIAVTGSNGKSTTASLIYHILSELGKKCILAGNIGQAFCSFPIHKPGIEYIVLEISSFQLDLIESFAPDVAILLNLTPDHLNRYPDFDAYCDSKMGIFRYQSSADYAVLYHDSIQIKKRDQDLKAQKLYFSSTARDTSAYLNDKFIHIGDQTFSMYNLKLKGHHNKLNCMAALLSIQALGLDMDRSMKAAASFKALPHRLEYVDSINGVAFYNDSKATNCDSTKNALESFERPIRVILGGSDKGEDFSLLTDSLQKHAVKAYVTGDTGDLMRQAWLGKMPLEFADDLESCVRQALADAAIGDNVVLSPACASFDRFRNFEDRGETFKTIVRKIKREKE